LQRFNDFMGQGLPQELGAFSTMDRRAFEKVVGYAAHPVHTEIPTAKMQMTLENVEKKTLSPHCFEIPAGYEEESQLATQYQPGSRSRARARHARGGATVQVETRAVGQPHRSRPALPRMPPPRGRGKPGCHAEADHAHGLRG